jgi:hypothetical protein
VRKAELARYGGTANIGRVTVNLDAIKGMDLKRDTRQGARDFGGQPLVYVASVDPVPDLDPALTHPGMETGTTQDPALLGIKDAIDKVAVQIELAAEEAQALNDDADRFRLAISPGHPRAQVLPAFINRSLEQGGVGRLPAAHDQPCSDNAVRRPF